MKIQIFSFIRLNVISSQFLSDDITQHKNETYKCHI